MPRGKKKECQKPAVIGVQNAGKGSQTNSKVSEGALPVSKDGSRDENITEDHCRPG